MRATKEKQISAKDRVKRVLKAELKRRGVTYAVLADKLAAIGVKDTERGIANKISRGGFSAVFLFQCLVAIGSSGVAIGSSRTEVY